MKNIWYRILRYFAKEYLKRRQKRGGADEKRDKVIYNALLLIKVEEAWEVYQREIKKVKP